jgi:hypothetical protein
MYIILIDLYKMVEGFRETAELDQSGFKIWRRAPPESTTLS